jgi:hypothetical protein
MPFSNQSYNPETLAVMTQAFNAAWDALQANGVPASVTQEQAREQLAQRIIRAVNQGDRDPERLRLLALKTFDVTVQAD